MNSQNQQNNTPDNSPEKLREATSKLIKIASVIIAIAIVTVCYGYTRVTDDAARMVVYGIGSVLSTLGSMLLIITFAARNAIKNKRNFFLYDRKSKTDIALSELTFDTVRHKICEFMSIFKRRGKLYVGDLLDDNSTVPEQFKPLFCYELLYELSQNDGISARAFLSFGSDCAEAFSKYLRQNGDYELASSVYTYIVDFSAGNERVAEFKEYISSKGEHIKSKMLAYAKDNIEKFN